MNDSLIGRSKSAITSNSTLNKEYSDFTIRELHHFHGEFSSIAQLKGNLAEEFGDNLPESTDFHLGYYYGK